MKRSSDGGDDGGGGGGKRPKKAEGAGKPRNTPLRRGPSHVGGGKRTKRGKRGRKELGSITLATKIALLLRFAFLKVDKTVRNWISEDEVLNVSKDYKAEDRASASRLFKKLKKDDAFFAAGEEAAKLAKAGQPDWSIQSALRTWFSVTNIDRLPENKKAEQQTLYVNFAAPKMASTYIPATRFEPTELRGIDGKVYAKSPNNLMEEAGFPPGLTADKFYFRGHCAFNCWMYIIQIVLMEGFTGLFRELIQHLDARGYMKLMMDALFINRGKVSLESEKARTQSIFQHKRAVMDEVHQQVTFKKTTVTVYGSKGFKIRTMQAKIHICKFCGKKTSVIEQPNPNREDFLVISGQKEAEVNKKCDKCQTDTPHIVKFVLNPYGIFIDLSNELKLSKNINELLQPFKQTLVTKGQEMEQIAINAVELFVDQGFSHAFVLKRNKDGILMQYDDQDSDNLCTPFKVEGRKNPLALNGVLYGSHTPVKNEEPKEP